jgi:hypothetical protein
MGTVIVTVNGKPLFDWEGSRAAAQNIIRIFPRMAAHVGLTPNALANDVIGHLEKKLLPSADPVDKLEKLAVMWRILTAESHDVERPGLIGDHVAHGIFAARIDTFDPSSYRLEVDAAESEFRGTRH